MKNVIFLAILLLITGCASPRLSRVFKGMEEGFKNASKDNSGDVKFCTSQKLGTMTYMNCQ